MKIKEKWYALLPGQSTVQEIEIMDVTEATVLIKDLKAYALSRYGVPDGKPYEAVRYSKFSVQLLEQLADDYYPGPL